MVNGSVEIGENCNISHVVTIGATRQGDKAGVPEIGNSVWMGTNSIMIGKIRVGDNVLIAPRAYVNFDVPDNSIVKGIPGQIISSLSAITWHINNKYEGTAE